MVKREKDKLQSEVQKFKNKSFAEGVIAGCYRWRLQMVRLILLKTKNDRFYENSDELKVFDTGEIEIFNKFVSKFEFDQMIGQAEALQKQWGKPRKCFSGSPAGSRVSAIGARMVILITMKGHRTYDMPRIGSRSIGV